ncbi:MAG TPA: RbsD/FucU domain-containing protein [Burkholderiaceae bacterium]|nr:RbsD/FucU domain-containing protein [Burkholderiaceae bacterium]
MLKHVPPLLTPDALHALASLGHGDDVAIVDAHFPAARVAAAHGARLVRLPGADAPAVLRAVLALLPLDAPGPAAWTMQVIGDAAAVPPAVAELNATLQAAGEAPAAVLARFAFYEHAERAFAIFVSGETRTYGNVLLRAGVLAPGAR